MDVKIKQAELEEIDKLTRDIAWRTKRLEEVKSSVKAMLLHNISIEPGRFTAKLRKQICRKCSVEVPGDRKARSIGG